MVCVVTILTPFIAGLALARRAGSATPQVVRDDLAARGGASAHEQQG